MSAQTNGSGTATPYSYGAFGEPSSWTGSRFRYTGQIILPAAQLYHYKARVYDPLDGRFLQTDPIGYEDDFNLYAYVGNDPVNFHDPEGEGKEASLKVLMQRGLIVRNASLAGTVHKATGIPFSAKGFPIFNSVAEKTVHLPGGFTSRTADYAAANAKAGLKETPKGMTWHHHEDLHTMQLVPTAIHRAVGHTGGFAITQLLRQLGSDPSMWAGLASFGVGLFLTSSDTDAGACADRGCEYRGSYTEGAGPSSDAASPSGGKRGPEPFSSDGNLIIGSRGCGSLVKTEGC